MSANLSLLTSFTDLHGNGEHHDGDEVGAVEDGRGQGQGPGDVADRGEVSRGKHQGPGGQGGHEAEESERGQAGPAPSPAHPGEVRQQRQE